MAKRELTSAAKAAKMIRTNLRAQGLDVRVRSDNFSMGNSVDVTMVDQSPEIRKLVEAYCGKFQYGYFDGMQDMYEHSNSRSDIPQAKYVNVHNNMSDGMRAAVYDHCRAYWGGGETLPPTYEEGRNVMFHGQYIDQFVYRQFSQADSTFWRERARKAKSAA